VAVAAVADRMSPRPRSPERDAVRLLGSPSFRPVPPAFEAQSGAEWGLDLFYEPHRAPLGVVFARAISLEPGPYELILETRDMPGPLAPDLSLANHRTAKVTRQSASVVAGTRSLTFRFTVDAAAEVDLSLQGGEPLSFARARLRRVGSE
jgi:hypothetical protein